MIQQTNYKARQSINNQYIKIKGASSINDVAIGFGKGWIVFAILSAMASAFSFYQDFTQSLGVVVTILLVVVLAVALEAFKHLSIKGMFSDMHLLSRSLVTVVALSLIGVSFYTHYKSSEPHSPKSKIMEEASFVMNTREEKQNLAELSNLS